MIEVNRIKRVPRYTQKAYEARAAADKRTNDCIKEWIEAEKASQKRHKMFEKQHGIERNPATQHDRFLEDFYQETGRTYSDGEILTKKIEALAEAVKQYPDLEGVIRFRLDDMINDKLKETT